MDQKEILRKTEDFVRATLQGAESGHDWWHIQRVVRNAKLIGQSEGVDNFVVELAALLHDIADAKFHDGDEDAGPQKAQSFLTSLNVDVPIIQHVEEIIRNVSFKGGHFTPTFFSRELSVVQDADRLDALGAIGIARAFNYGGFKNRELYNPDTQPDLHLTREAYKKSNGPTINHFYEKLLLLKDLMQTKTGRKLAEKRHAFMEEFLRQFYNEWEGNE
jgi:uncharacterized protein